MPHVARYVKQKILHSFSRAHLLTEDVSCDSTDVDRYFQEKCDIFAFSPSTIHQILCQMPVSERIDFLLKNKDYVTENEQAILGYQMLGDNLFEGFQYSDFSKISKENPELFKSIILKCYFDISGQFDSESAFSLLIEHSNLFFNSEPIVFCEFFEKIGKKDRGDLYTNKIVSDCDFELEKKYASLLETYSDYMSTFEPDVIMDFFKMIEGENNYKNFHEKFLPIFKEYFEKEEFTQVGVYLADVGFDRFCYLADFYHEKFDQLHFQRIYFYLSDQVLEKIYLNDEKMSKISTANTLYLGIRSDHFQKYVEKRKKEVKYDDVFPLDTFEIPFEDSKRIKNKMAEYTIFAKNNFALDGQLEDLKDTETIFSNAFMKNLLELKKNPSLNGEDTYQFFLDKVSKMIPKKEEDGKEYSVLFWLLSNQKISFRELQLISNYNQLILFNRLRFLNICADDFSSEQLSQINVKRLRSLFAKYGTDPEPNYDKFEGCIYRDPLNDMILKSYLLFGFKNANTFLSKCPSQNDLEHLVDKIDISNVVIGENHEPVVNVKLNNLLFSDSNVLDSMFQDKNSPLYRYFPRLFNEWGGLDYYNKNVLSLRDCLNLLEHSQVVLPPQYEELREELRYIGSDSKTVDETKKLYNQLLCRNASTIPTVSGSTSDYDYQVLPYDDVHQISVGAKTNCCFTPNGASKSSLFQACAGKNGRVFTVMKDGKLVAHSWIWRNGNLLCFDNIETSKGLDRFDFLSCYESAAKQIVDISKECEKEKAIDVVTIGVHPRDDKIDGLDQYDYYTKDKISSEKAIVMDALPQPIETPIYSDAKDTQRILKKGTLRLYQSNYLYYDKRCNKIDSYHQSNSYDKEFIDSLNVKFNGIMNRKCSLEYNPKHYSVLDYQDVYLGRDFAITVDAKHHISIYDLEYDSRSKKDIQKILQKIN